MGFWVIKTAGQWRASADSVSTTVPLPPPPPDTPPYSRGIAWSPILGLFVMVGEEGGAVIATSPDGDCWTNRTSPFYGSPGGTSVCWSPDLALFVATSASGPGGSPLIATSDDGVTWTAQTTPWDIADVGPTLFDVCWSPELGLFAAVGGDHYGDTGISTESVLTSPDGITWTGYSTAFDGESGTAIAGSVCSAGSIGFIVGGVGSSGKMIVTSVDGSSWVTQSTPKDSGGNAILGLVWSPDLGLAVAGTYGFGSECVMTSSDGAAWTVRSSPFDGEFAVGHFCWSPELGLFLIWGAVSGFPVTYHVATSPDGITWTTHSPALSSWSPSTCWSAELGLFVVGGGISGWWGYHSADGITWTEAAGCP